MDAWREVARAAQRSHGIVTYDRLRGAGLSDSQVRRCASEGRLVDLGYGVFRHRRGGGDLTAIVACAGSAWRWRGSNGGM